MSASTPQRSRPMAKAFALASLRTKQESGVVRQYLSVHLREADSKDEAIGQVFKLLQESVEIGWSIQDIVAIPVFKEKEPTDG